MRMEGDRGGPRVRWEVTERNTEWLGETQKLPGRQAMRDTGSEGGETEESLAPKHTEEETARRGQRRKAKGSLSERWER